MNTLRFLRPSVPASVCDFLAVLFLLLSPAVPLSAEELDFSDQLPRVPPRSAQDAMLAFHLADGFRIELVASEPLLVDPVAIAFDADARMYVVEMRGYSEDSDQDLGRIRLLTDTNDDGRYDTSTVFADGLSWPTAVTCFDGGIYVAAAPRLMFLRDTDGDGIADQRKQIFEGFGLSNVQGLVNTLTWGLDNRIHGAPSSTGASLANKVWPRQPKLLLRGRDFAFDPRSHRLFPTSGGGQHGMSFDRWGEKFVCSNSDHMQQVLFEDRYLLRNPSMKPLSARVSIAADGPQAPVFRSSPVESWRVIRTRLRVSGAVPGPIEGGGTAAGYFTSATGIVIYRGNAWPNTMLDLALVCDVGSNLVHRKRLIDTGIRYRAERIDEKSEFLTSDDIWFRPVQLTNGPDGALYIIDMYREVIEHPLSLPPMIKRHLDLTSGRNRGRIYRIVPEDFKHRPNPRLSRLTASQCVELLGHPNGWHRETAARLLYERDDPTVAPALRSLLTNCPRAEGRLQALYALDSLSSLTGANLIAALTDDESHVRRHAVRLSERLVPGNPDLENALLAMATDPALKVRYQLAFTLGGLPETRVRQEALASLARQSVRFPYALSAVQSSLADGATDLLDRLARDEDFRAQTTGTAFLRQLARQIRRQEDPGDARRLSVMIADLEDQAGTLLPDLLIDLTVPPGNRLAKRLRKGPTRDVIKRTIERAWEVASDDARSTKDRQVAVHRLVLSKWEQAASWYNELLEAFQPLPVQLAAIESLSSRSSPDVADQLLSAWDGYSPTLRRPIVQLLMTRSPWQSRLLAALESHRINLQELSVSQQQQLARVAGVQRWSEIEGSLSRSVGEGMEEIVETYRQAMQNEANPIAGRETFRRLCAPCHRLEDFGHELGPNLAAVQNRGADAILLNMLDPNREVNPQYLAYSAVTNDGRIVSGMIRSETATSIELVEADNKSETLLRDDIDTLTSTNQSLMPTGFEKQITPAMMSDLIGYLRSLQ